MHENVILADEKCSVPDSNDKKWAYYAHTNQKSMILDANKLAFSPNIYLYDITILFMTTQNFNVLSSLTSLIVQ